MKSTIGRNWSLGGFARHQQWTRWLSNTTSVHHKADYAWCEQLEDEMIDQIGANIRDSGITVPGRMYGRMMEYYTSPRRHDFLTNLAVTWHVVVFAGYQRKIEARKSHCRFYCMACIPMLNLTHEQQTKLRSFVRTMQVDQTNLDDFGAFFWKRENYCYRCKNSLFFPINEFNDVDHTLEVVPPPGLQCNEIIIK